MAIESSKISKIFGENPEENKGEEKSSWLSEYEGQLAVDAYQTDDSIIIKAPIAGVKPEHLEVSIANDMITIKGERKLEEEIRAENYFAQECYWGSFSRQLTLPPGTDTEKAKAGLKNGVLTIKIPKVPQSQTKVIKISTDEE